jgi:hypothetical protein
VAGNRPNCPCRTRATAPRPTPTALCRRPRRSQPRPQRASVGRSASAGSCRGVTGDALRAKGAGYAFVMRNAGRGRAAQAARAAAAAAPADARLAPGQVPMCPPSHAVLVRPNGSTRARAAPVLWPRGWQARPRELGVGAERQLRLGLVRRLRLPRAIPEGSPAATTTLSGQQPSGCNGPHGDSPGLRAPVQTKSLPVEAWGASGRAHLGARSIVGRCLKVAMPGCNHASTWP